ncbi:TPA: YolD-like family protein, partial [Staphylococcus aureus]|nr:YolD-like family protein [Staphylococcus aureus]
KILKKDEIGNTFSFSDTNNNIYNLNNTNVCSIT